MCTDIDNYPHSLQWSLVLYVLRTEKASEDLGLVNNEGHLKVQSCGSSGNLGSVDWKIFS